MPHKPKPHKYVRNLVFRYSYRDYLKGENVNYFFSLSDIKERLRQKYGEVNFNDLPSWLDEFKGQVLTDPKGNGYMQT